MAKLVKGDVLDFFFTLSHALMKLSWPDLNQVLMSDLQIDRI